ncbi:MAG: hypothetical protein IK005_07850 [Paludibacteraceae bacterium]|nr:hypothetical protein [Paludibacteraceae bacterium]
MGKTQAVKEVAKLVCLSIFSLFYFVSGFKLSSAPYDWGLGDGSGLLLWIAVVALFLLLMFLPLIGALYVDRNKKRIKPYVVIFAGSALLFLLNWLIPRLTCGGAKYLDTSTSEWILYASMPFLYGGISYFIFEFFDDSSKNKEGDSSCEPDEGAGGV